MNHRSRIIRALDRASGEHGTPNAFSSRWLVEEEGCPLTRRQINAVGRRLRAEDLALHYVPGEIGEVEAEYAGRGVWRVTAMHP